MFKRIAVVHDWLPVYAGAERVLEQILNVFPDADLFSMVDLLPASERVFLKGKKVRTSFLQKWGWVRRNYRKFLPLMPIAVEQFDLSDYELIVSSSYAVAKGVVTGPGQLHVCYCHSPMRYAWDLQHQYLRESRLEKGPASILARIILHYMRQWDVQSSNRVDHFIANSQFIRQRIHTIYRREANVINPPVDVDRFALCEIKGDYYVAASRLVPYKMIGIIIDAFNQMPERELRVIGDGPQFEEFKRRAKPNVKLMGHQPFENLHRQLQGARAYICAALEDFGILPVEAQACGTPVIAYGKGGVRETVVPGQTGLFFNEQTAEAVVQAVSNFEGMKDAFAPRTIRLNAERYSAQRFRDSIRNEIESCWVAKYGAPDGASGMFPVPHSIDDEALAV